MGWNQRRTRGVAAREAAAIAESASASPSSLNELASTFIAVSSLSLSAPPVLVPGPVAAAVAVPDSDTDSDAPPQPPPRPKRKRKKVGKYHPLTDAQRLDILRLRIDEGKTATTLARLYKDRGIIVPLGTLYTLFRKQARNLPIVHRARRSRGSTYTQADKDLVCRVQDEHNDWHYDQLKQAWREANPTSTRCPSNYTIHKWLKEAGFTDKLLVPVPQARNAPFNIADRKEYCMRASAWDRDTLVFIDETSFDRNLHSTRGRSRRGTVATYTRLNSPGPGIKVCAAVSPALGLVMFEPQLTPWNGDDFARFMTRLCALPEMQHQSMKFVMDNVRLHHTEVVKDALRAQAIQHQVEFLPTYSPHLNPIEYCFHNWKTEIKHVDQLNDRRSLSQQVDDTRTCITAHLVTRIVDHVYQYYAHCIQELPLEDFKPIGNRVQRARQEVELQRQDMDEDEQKE
jgi:transposase